MKNGFWKVSLTASMLLAGAGLICIILGSLFGGVSKAADALGNMENTFYEIWREWE